MKRCMYCGNENDDSSQNCSKCGNRLLDIKMEQVEPVQEVAEERTPDYSPEAVSSDTQIYNSPITETAAAQEPVMAQEAEQSVQEQPVPAMEQEAEQSVQEQSAPAMAQAKESMSGTAPEPNTTAQRVFDDGATAEPAAMDPGAMTQEIPTQGTAQEAAMPGFSNQPYSGAGVMPGQTSPEARPMYNQPYAGAQYQYSQPYGTQEYGAARPTAGSAYAQQGVDVQQQYGGQAYGYQQEAQQYGYGAQPGQPGRSDFGRTQPFEGGGKQLLIKARKMVKSPLFLLVTLFYTIMVGATVTGVITGVPADTLDTTQASLKGILGSNVLFNFVNGIVDSVQGMSPYVMIGINLVLLIPTALICIGFWMAFIATSNSKEQISTAGYTMVKVMTILKFIGLCIFFTAGLILCVAFVVAAGASSSVTSIIVGVVALLIMIIISVLVIMFYIQMLHCIKVIKFNAKTGADIGTIALFIPIIGIIMAIGTGLSMIPMSPDDIIGLLTTGATTAWMLFGSIWLLIYRAKVRR